KPLKMEIDSGAGPTIISESTMQRLGIDRRVLCGRKSTLRMYTGQTLNVVGSATVPVKYKERHAKLKVVIVESDGASLLGREWFQPLGISIEGINRIDPSNTIKTILDEYKDVFRQGLGKSKSQ